MHHQSTDFPLTFVDHTNNSFIGVFGIDGMEGFLVLIASDEETNCCFLSHLSKYRRKSASQRASGAFPMVGAQAAGCDEQCCGARCAPTLYFKRLPLCCSPQRCHREVWRACMHIHDQYWFERRSDIPGNTGAHRNIRPFSSLYSLSRSTP